MSEVKAINVQQLNKLMNENKDFQLIDVREPHENEICTLNAELIPVGTIPENIDRISKDKQVVIHCRSGVRSANVISYLQQNFNFNNLYNLEGGILAWADEIDTSMEKY